MSSPGSQTPFGAPPTQPSPPPPGSIAHAMQSASVNGGMHWPNPRHAPQPISVAGSMQSSAPPPPPVQSAGQFVLFSPPAISQVLSPQTGPAGWQSAGQFCIVSPFSHELLPHTGFDV